MRKLPILEGLRVAQPCAAEWAAMTGNDEARHCAHCNQNVYNLSALTRAQAEELVRSATARLCTRYFHRADGTMLLRDGAVAYRPTRLIAAGVAALALTGAAGLLGRARPAPAAAIDPPQASAPQVQIEREIQISHEPPPPPAPPPRPRPRPRHEIDQEVFRTAGVMIRTDDLETLGK